MCPLAEELLAGVLLVGILPFGGLLATEEEMVLVADGILERKEKTPLELETLGEEKVLLSSDALFVLWYSWHLFSSADWTGGHRHLCFWSLPMCRFAGTTIKIREYKHISWKNEIGKEI